MSDGIGEEEEVLAGGGTTTVVRVGATVRRPVRPWSPAVRALLRQLRAAGVAGVPGWHGVDERDRDIFDYLPGEVGHYPLPGPVRGDPALVTAGALLRSLHDASVRLAAAPALPWQFPPLEPVEVICHGDFAPYNCVYQDGATVGVIDFDAARPGPRWWDLAYALYRFAPLAHPTNPDAFGDPAEQARRARLFLDAYGCAPAQRHQALYGVGPRLRSLVAFMRAAAAAGDPNFTRHIEEGHVDLYLRDIEYVERQIPDWSGTIVEQLVQDHGKR